jgi:hypothetical protein
MVNFMDGHYSVKQAAAAMHVSTRTIRNRITSGELPAVWEERGKGMSQWWIPIAVVQTAATTTVEVVPVTRQLSPAELGQIVHTAVQNAVQEVVKTEIQQLRGELESHFRRQDERIREALTPKPEKKKGFWKKLLRLP